MQTIDIRYPTKLLEQEKPLIRESVEKARWKIVSNDFLKSLGLLCGDPHALFAWRLKEAPWDSKAGAPFWPDKASFFDRITFRATVAQLVRQAESDKQLEEWLRRLLAPFGPRVDRFQEIGKRERFLIEYWIAPDNHPHFFQKSLCFYSNLALAQALHFETQRTLPGTQWKTFPSSRLGTAEKTVAKLVERLGLRPAKKRVIRQLPFKDGRIIPVPFRTVEV